MIHLIHATDDPLAHPLLAQMFTARKQVFVDLLGWQVPVIEGTYEIDQFDRPGARYLIVTDATGQHVASARLLPSMQPHLLATIFPGLCEAAPPQSEDIFEITRFCLDRSLGASTRRLARDALVCGLVDYAHSHAIQGYSAIAGFTWAKQILAFGWRCRLLGTPQSINGERLVALEIMIDADTRATLASAGITAPSMPFVAAA